MKDIYRQLMLAEVLVEYKQDDVTIISFSTTITGAYEWLDGIMLVGDNGATEIYVANAESVFDDDEDVNYFVCNNGAMTITPV